MKKIILFLIVCSPLTLTANDQIPVDDSAPRDYMFAYERPGVRAPASVKTKQVKAVAQPKKKVVSKQR
jgi:hypothetical protein